MSRQRQREIQPQSSLFLKTENNSNPSIKCSIALERLATTCQKGLGMKTQTRDTLQTRENEHSIKKSTFSMHEVGNISEIHEMDVNNSINANLSKESWQLKSKTNETVFNEATKRKSRSSTKMLQSKKR